MKTFEQEHGYVKPISNSVRRFSKNLDVIPLDFVPVIGSVFSEKASASLTAAANAMDVGSKLALEWDIAGAGEELYMGTCETAVTFIPFAEYANFLTGGEIDLRRTSRKVASNIYNTVTFRESSVYKPVLAI